MILSRDQQVGLQFAQSAIHLLFLLVDLFNLAKTYENTQTSNAERERSNKVRCFVEWNTTNVRNLDRSIPKPRASRESSTRNDDDSNQISTRNRSIRKRIAIVEKTTSSKTRSTCKCQKTTKN